MMLYNLCTVVLSFFLACPAWSSSTLGEVLWQCAQEKGLKGSLCIDLMPRPVVEYALEMSKDASPLEMAQRLDMDAWILDEWLLTNVPHEMSKAVNSNTLMHLTTIAEAMERNAGDEEIRLSWTKVGFRMLVDSCEKFADSRIEVEGGWHPYMPIYTEPVHVGKYLSGLLSNAVIICHGEIDSSKSGHYIIRFPDNLPWTLSTIGGPTSIEQEAKLRTNAIVTRWTLMEDWRAALAARERTFEASERMHISPDTFSILIDETNVVREFKVLLGGQIVESIAELVVESSSSLLGIPEIEGQGDRARVYFRGIDGSRGLFRTDDQIHD